MGEQDIKTMIEGSTRTTHSSTHYKPPIRSGTQLADSLGRLKIDLAFPSGARYYTPFSEPQFKAPQAKKSFLNGHLVCRLGFTARKYVLNCHSFRA